MRADDRVSVRAFAYQQALPFWRSRGLDVTPLDERVSTQQVEELVWAMQPAVVLTGSSVNGVDLERQFIAGARALRIPSLALLDFWSNYRARFADIHGTLDSSPDKIAVMDQRARAEMIAAGFDPASLVVTGQPALDDLARTAAEFTSAQRASLRESLGVDPASLLVCFVSQPLSRLYPDPADSRHPGYDEFQVARLVAATLDDMASQHTARITLAIRQHPREDPGKFDFLRCQHVKLVNATAGKSRHLALAADLVVGMTSMLLVEAHWMGCPTLSVQPGLNALDPLPAGLIRSVYYVNLLEAALREMLLLDADPATSIKPMMSADNPGGATHRVLKLVLEMAGFTSDLPQP